MDETPKVIVEDLPRSEQAEPEAKAGTSAGTTEHLLIARQFNIDHPTKEEEGKLIEIWEHARKLSKTGDYQDVIWQVMNLKGTLGAPRLGESPLDKVYRWAKLKRQAEVIDAELRRI